MVNVGHRVYQENLVKMVYLVFLVQKENKEKEEKMVKLAPRVNQAPLGPLA